MNEFSIGTVQYHIMGVPRLKFREILKEYGTRGFLYVSWTGKGQCFLAQSIPPLVKMIESVASRRVYSSCFYRILRREAKGVTSKGFYIKRLPDVQMLNNFLQQFDLLFVCSQNWDLWILDEESLPTEEAAFTELLK